MISHYNNDERMAAMKMAIRSKFGNRVHFTMDEKGGRMDEYSVVLCVYLYPPPWNRDDFLPKDFEDKGVWVDEGELHHFIPDPESEGLKTRAERAALEHIAKKHIQHLEDLRAHCDALLVMTISDTYGGYLLEVGACDYVTHSINAPPEYHFDAIVRNLW